MSSIVHASDPTDFYRFWSGNEVWSLRIGQLVELLLLIITSPERVTGMSLPPYSTEQLLVLSGKKKTPYSAELILVILCKNMTQVQSKEEMD